MHNRIKNRIIFKRNSLFFTKAICGVSVLEISVCMLIGAIIFIIAMTFYNRRLEYDVFQASAEQISYDLRQLKSYIEINGDKGFIYNSKCVAKLKDQQLTDDILNLKKTDTLLGQKVNIYIKKLSCNDYSTASEKYEVLLTLAPGKEINVSNVGRITKMLGYQGGRYNNKLKGFTGWRQSWNVILSDWEIVHDDFIMAAYTSFFRHKYPYFGKSELFNVELQAFNSGVITHQEPVKISSREDKVRVIWRGAQIHSALLMITVENDRGYSQTINMNVLSQEYGGCVSITPLNLLPENASGQYQISIKITVSGLNGIPSNAVNQKLNIII